MQIRQEKGCYTLYKENEAIGTAVVDGTTILRLEVVPRWRGRGYGSYLLKELLRQNGGLDPKQATRFTAPLPRDAGSTFYPRAGGWCAAACPTCPPCSSAMRF
mgnify:CR=1 FL=1